METLEYQGNGLKYLTIYPDGYSPGVDYPLVIVLHGFGASMHDMASLCPSMDRKGYIYSLPNGHLSLQIGPGQVGYAWLPLSGERTEDHSKRVVELLDKFVDEVMEQHNVKPGRVVMMGFSQGGGMTYQIGLGKPEIFPGLAVLSSTMPEPAVLDGLLPPQRTQAIFIAHGTSDEVVPMTRAQDALAFLEERGYQPVYKEYPIKHEITQEVLDDLASWIKEVVPPARV